MIEHLIAVWRDLWFLVVFGLACAFYLHGERAAWREGVRAERERRAVIRAFEIAWEAHHPGVRRPPIAQDMIEIMVGERLVTLPEDRPAKKRRFRGCGRCTGCTGIPGHGYCGPSAPAPPMPGDSRDPRPTGAI
jgi:hypothetical protein